MINVLFVCLGNICRSPMAEAVFRDLVKREGLEDKIMVDSAGTANYHTGSSLHRGTKDILQKNNISSEGLIARQVEPKDTVDFQYIIVMDSSNQKNVEKIIDTNSQSEIVKLLDLTDLHKGLDVPDPYYTGNFEEVYNLIKDGCEKLLENIKKTF